MSINFENIVILIIFLSAVLYLGNMIKQQFSAKGGACAKNCGGACGVKFEIPNQEKLVQKK